MFKMHWQVTTVLGNVEATGQEKGKLVSPVRRVGKVVCGHENQEGKRRVSSSSWELLREILHKCCAAPEAWTGEPLGWTTGRQFYLILGNNHFFQFPYLMLWHLGHRRDCSCWLIPRDSLRVCLPYANQPLPLWGALTLWTIIHLP